MFATSFNSVRFSVAIEKDNISVPLFLSFSNKPVSSFIFQLFLFNISNACNLGVEVETFILDLCSSISFGNGLLIVCPYPNKAFSTICSLFIPTSSASLISIFVNTCALFWLKNNAKILFNGNFTTLTPSDSLFLTYSGGKPPTASISLLSNALINSSSFG